MARYSKRKRYKLGKSKTKRYKRSKKKRYSLIPRGGYRL